MPVIDVDALLAPVTVEAPAGPDLEYDPTFLEVMRLAEGTPERVMGNTTVPAEEPDWRQIQTLCAGLLARSKDLRVALLLLRALIHTESLPGLRLGMGLLKGLLEQHWESLHPELDASDDNDPTERMNLLSALTDAGAMLGPLREAPLVHSRVFGKVSLRDIEIAEGKSRPRPGTEALDAASISAAFHDCELDELAASTGAASAALADARALGASLAARVSTSQIPDIDPFLALLSSVTAALQPRLAERQPTPVAEETAADPDALEAEQDMVHPTGSSTLGPARIASREDVVRVLDTLCEYYARNEPSSPVPLLLKRARRLATKDFLDIVRDLAPEALEKLALIRGPDSDA